MTKHYVLCLNPQAQFEWDRCVLRNPITGERPDLTAMVSQAVNGQPGAYLVSVSLEVTVLETVSLPARQSQPSLGTQSSKLSPSTQAVAA
ncbi:MAG: hypothetical protein HC890_11390 [Chloroflexaceae bacterium]|nr:hypothetical protein [Chloroflexaceae bacterium]